jgi:hypothetical protein
MTRREELAWAALIAVILLAAWLRFPGVWDFAKGPF